MSSWYNGRSWSANAFKKRLLESRNRPTEQGRKNALDDVNGLLRKNPDKYQPLYDEVMKELGGSTMSTNTNNYIEIKTGGITLRKQGSSLTVKLDAKFDYSEVAVKAFRTDLDQGLGLIEQAAKLEQSEARVASLDV